MDDVTPSKSVWDSITGGNWELDLDNLPPFAPLHDVKFHKPITTTDNKTVPYINDIIPAFAAQDEPNGLSLEDARRREREFVRRQAAQQQFIQNEQNRLRLQDLARQQQQAQSAHWSDMNAALHGHGILGNPRILRPNDNYEKQSKPIPKAKPKKVERYEEPKRTLDLDHLD